MSAPSPVTAPEAAPSVVDDDDERLVQLEELLALELLTQAEYDEKRAQILSSA